VRLRVYTAALALTGLFGAIAVKAYGVQLTDAEHYRELARRQHTKMLEIPAPRGIVYDRTGSELAVTADVDSVFASPHEVVDVVGTAAKLAALLSLDVREVEARLSSRRYFAWLERHVSVEEARAIRDAGLPGVDIAREPRRYYPGRSLAGPVLGFAGIDGEGLDGIELSMNDLLRGRRARLAAVRDASGTVLPAADEAAAADRAVAGASITLTLDRFIQFSAERALAEAVATHKARAGTVVVLDVTTGGVLAMAASPGYDPNEPAARVGEGARNRAITDAYEVGSVMKVFTVAAALEAGAVRPEQWIDVEHGEYRVAGKTFRDTYKDVMLTVGGVIKRSSNVGAIKIARMLGKQRLHDALVRLGFGEKTGIELGGERAGLVRDPARWGEIGLATAAFGYGMTATPLQVAAALAAIGNGGIMHAPRLVERVVSAEGRVLYARQPRGKRVLSEATAAAMLPMLASVFDRGRDGGTARSVWVDGYRAGGKTGTAYRIDPATKKYSKDHYLSSFMGLAPIDAPRIAIVIVIDEPRGQKHYGGEVAGPVFARVVSESLRYLGLPPEPTPRPEEETKGPTGPGGDGDGDGDGVAADPPPEREPVAVTDGAEPTGAPANEAEAAEAEPGAAIGPTVPDFRGLGVARSLAVAREAGIAIEIEGTGRAVEQLPLPGPAAAPVTCRVTFSAAD
jgi:cell division protein FtsI (penicillin-binding protein 3)